MKLAHYHRYPFYDYSRGASLFVSLSTEPRRRLFGEVAAGGEMRLSPFGVEVFGAIEFTFSKAPGFTLYGHRVLPDHCHFRIYLAPGVENARAAALINTAVGRFKSYTTHLYQKKYGGRGALWQEGFHDWLCLSREMIDAVERYIDYNALKWWLRNGGGRALMALHEPLESPRIGREEYWRGVGAVELLNRPGTEAGALQDGGPAAHHGGGPAQEGERASGSAGALQDGGPAGVQDGGPASDVQKSRPSAGGDSRPLVSLRVSRRCSARDIAAVVGRIAAKAGDLTVISGFISPGERAVLDALLANPAARLIKVSPYALPHDYAPPVALMGAIAERRLAIIARGNSPEEISRAACLDYNARIVEIADKAAYALPGEVRWLR